MGAQAATCFMLHSELESHGTACADYIASTLILECVYGSTVSFLYFHVAALCVYRHEVVSLFRPEDDPLSLSL